ncbi:hypothetical protein ACT3XE_18865 [Halomonas sp. AOP7-C1-8]
MQRRHEPVIFAVPGHGKAAIVVFGVSVHSATFCHPAKIRPKVTSQFPTRGYRHEKAPHTRPVAGFGQSAA